jgi:hypothetical protein
MNKSIVTIVFSVMAATAFFCAAVPCRAVDKDEESIWAEEEPRRPRRDFELTDERIERILSRLRQADPDKADEIEKLRRQDPEKFKAQLRKITRERFGPMRRDRRGHEGGREFRPGSDRPGKGGPHGGPGEQGRFGPMMRRHSKKFGEFLEWMQKNYPKQAEKFEHWQKQEHRPARGGHLPPGAGTYMKIFEASKDNPKLAEVLKQDLQLKKQRTKLLRKIKRAKTDDERNELVTELKEVIGARYDLLVSRKQLEYEQLRARLEELRKKVEESQAEVVKWKDPDYKSKNVQSRTDDLVGGVEKFKWE